jgi:4-hydroxy-4-methyl-2-oxoglutarate aldolase
MHDPIVERFGALSTASVSDALDHLGLTGAALGIAPVAGRAQLVGRAFTVLYAPASAPPGTVGDYIDDVAPGSVIVLDNGGRLDCTVWGDILTEIASAKGIAGTVIDGVCRDVRKSFDLAYPLYSRARFMRTGKDRVQVEAVNTTVTLSGVRVCAGDLVVGNDDGIVVVPRAHEEAVLEQALRIERAEDAIREAVRGGMSLRQARREFRYHELQRAEAR